MVMFRGRPSEKPKATKLINVATTNDNFNSDENWKKIVGSVRPLHSQDIRSPPPQIPRAAKAFSRASTSSDDDFFGESPALGTSSPTLSTSSWGTSSYGSCNSLQELTGSGRMKPSESTNSLSRMSDNMSRYASTLNLHDLDVDEEVDDDVDNDNDNDNILEICEADDMIDSKADEFIARFYDQMKSQE
ncbi:hypothetical protein POM88_022818 [Heracleum sosnowskyi]|uniref:Uncharacterized protein n=1 Tax=Heracleum sosnowskyi TaxID=360622 RepID=A0AAD8MV83_9APIA|nr:hypothetical protein POM88_022818 [Heracleum sosnowskyi]